MGADYRPAFSEDVLKVGKGRATRRAEEAEGKREAGGWASRERFGPSGGVTRSSRINSNMIVARALPYSPKRSLGAPSPFSAAC